MKTYYFKIREKYIDSIVNGTKRREYRLANPERREIKVGDSIILISNQNRKNYVRVSVKSRRIYSSWHDALCEYWDEDFKGLGLIERSHVPWLFSTLTNNQKGFLS